MQSKLTSGGSYTITVESIERAIATRRREADILASTAQNEAELLRLFRGRHRMYWMATRNVPDDVRNEELERNERKKLPPDTPEVDLPGQKSLAIGSMPILLSLGNYINRHYRQDSVISFKGARQIFKTEGMRTTARKYKNGLRNRWLTTRTLGWHSNARIVFEHCIRQKIDPHLFRWLEEGFTDRERKNRKEIFAAIDKMLDFSNPVEMANQTQPA